MAGDPESITVVVAKPRVNVYTALVIVASVALLAATIVMLCQFSNWYTLGELV